MSSALPNPGRLYADVLWDTSLLPAFIVDGNGDKKTKIVSGSINGVDWTTNNPTNDTQMRNNINAIISTRCYGALSGGYNCLQNTYTYTPPGPPPQVPETTTGNNIPARYIVMGGDNTTLPAGSQRQLADQLQVTAVGQFTFLQTDWRSPPNYNPGPLA